MFLNMIVSSGARLTTLAITLCFISVLTSCGEKLTGTSEDSDSDTDSTTATDADTDTDTDSDADTDYSLDSLSQSVFAQDRMIEYHVTMDPAVYQDMQEHGNDEEYRPAALEIVDNGQTVQYANVGYRYKGAWSLHHCWDDNGGVRDYSGGCAKISTRIAFDEYDAETRFHGLKNLNLHAMSGDNTKMRDRLAYSLFNRFGVDAPMTAHAKLFINGKYEGLVLAVEQIDGRYTAAHYPDGGDGNLYKEIWPVAGMDEGWVMPALKTNEDPADNPDVSDFIAFGNAVGNTTEATFAADLEGLVEIEALLRYMAVDRALRNWDGVTAFYSPNSPHNFYWYHDNGPTDMFHLIPWDLDNTLWTFDPFMDPQGWISAAPIPDWNIKPLSCAPMGVWTVDNPVQVTPPGCDTLMHMLAKTGWDQFAVAGQEFLDTLFIYEDMNTSITEWAAQIAPALVDDPYVDDAQWQQDLADFRSILQDAIFTFTQHLDEGYIEEELWIEPGDADLNAAIPESGLVYDIINNYEFTGGAAGAVPTLVTSYVATESTLAVAWNEVSPISGGADLRLDVDFVQRSGAWNEYAGAILGVEGGEMDASGMIEMSVTLQADTTRNVRIDFRSPVYDEGFGGIPAVFSKEFVVTDTPTIFKIPISSIGYPNWARDGWGVNQGWTYSDSQARDEVLSRLSGVSFEIYPQRSGAGEMLQPAESVWLQIDNLYFR